MVLVLPTGGGKTLVGCEIARAALNKSRRVLWLAHRTELVDQACSRVAAYGLPASAIAADSEHAYRPDSPVHVASVQTLLARKIFPPADLVIPDECHHYGRTAEQWSSLLDHYPRAHVLGLTATPERGDGAGLAPLFDALVVGATVRQLTDRGFLVPCEIVRPAHALASSEIAQDPVDAYREHGDDRQGFIFSRSVAESEEVAKRLRSVGVTAECVSAKTPAPQRRQALEGFRRGEVSVLCNVYVFTEGTDLPAAAVCILARGAGTAGVLLQMVGRVLRPAPGKESALLIDLQGVTHELGAPDAHRVWSIDGKACSLGSAPDQLSMCARCGAPLDPYTPYPCAACQYVPEPTKTRVVDMALVRAARRSEVTEDKWKTLLRWAGVAVEKQYKPQWLYARYRGFYGASPPDGWVWKALRAARGDRMVGA